MNFCFTLCMNMYAAFKHLMFWSQCPRICHILRQAHSLVTLSFINKKLAAFQFMLLMRELKFSDH